MVFKKFKIDQRVQSGAHAGMITRAIAAQVAVSDSKVWKILRQQ